MTRRHKQVINNQCFCGPVDAIVQATSAAFRAFSTPWDGSVHAARNKKREEKRHSYCVILGVRPDHPRIHIESNVGECDVYVGGKVRVAKFMMF